MNIEPKRIKIADLIEGYSNDPDTGVKGFGGKLDIRPPYQRAVYYKHLRAHETRHELVCRLLL